VLAAVRQPPRQPAMPLHRRVDNLRAPQERLREAKR
jgi:hypothetical protein